MQFSFERRPKTQTKDSQAASSNDSAAEKLKKAIERNRMKMDKRQGAAPKSAPSRPAQAPMGMPASSKASSPEGQSLLDKMRARREEANGKNLAPPPLPPQNTINRQATMSTNMDSIAQRRQVTDPSKIELAGELRRSTTAPAVVNYSVAEPVKAPVKKSVSAKRKVKTKNNTQTLGMSSWLVKGSWCFCAFLIARLVFSDGGVIEYFDKKEVYNNKIREMEIVTKDNELLMEELESIKDSGKYQKKLVRDHLGYIAKDEYLVLFPKPKSIEQQSQDVSSI